MFLREIGAVRYGGLKKVTLGPLGAGLNVVFGRNEAGKSTLTSLVRHVLFGFPRGRTSERLYQPGSGDHRVGRSYLDGFETQPGRRDGGHCRPSPLDDVVVRRRRAGDLR